MAMKKRFYSVNGQMMGYEEGGVKKDFLTDHLGSITAEIDQTQTRTYDTRYSAYGRNNWSTGTGCGFGWVGSYGYRETSLFHMSHYDRARHYSYVTGNWSTVDPLWPDEASYGYVSGRATRWIDPSGLINFIGLITPPLDIIPKILPILPILPSILPKCIGIIGGISVLQGKPCDPNQELRCEIKCMSAGGRMADCVTDEMGFVVCKCFGGNPIFDIDPIGLLRRKPRELIA